MAPSKTVSYIELTVYIPNNIKIHDKAKMQTITRFMKMIRNGLSDLNFAINQRLNNYVYFRVKLLWLLTDQRVKYPDN